MSKHDDLIKDQFTKQAVPFSKVKWHNHEALQKLIAESIGVRAEDTVLDVACGPGIMACEIAKTGGQVTGIDLTPAMIELAQKRQKDMRLKNLSWRVGDVYALPFADDSFSVVLTRFSFHHFLEPQKVLAEMCRAAKTAARIAVIDMFASEDRVQGDALNHLEKLRDPSHVRALTLTEHRGFVEKACLTETSWKFFRLKVELETQLAASFPRKGDAQRIREIIRRDIKEKSTGLEPYEEDGKIYYSYPIMILTGIKK